MVRPPSASGRRVAERKPVRRGESPASPRAEASASRVAARAMRRSIPPKIALWTGYSAYQYSRPARPCGSKMAVCRTTLPSPSPRTSNCSHARPGTFISARSRRRRSRSIASTRQKSTASPSCSVSGSRRPRRIPGPPTSRSANPRIRHSASRNQPHPADAPTPDAAAASADPRPRRREARPGGRAAPRASGAERRRCVRPPRLRELAILVRERAGDRLAHVAGANAREQLGGPRRRHHRLVPHAVDQLLPDARVHRRHEAEPAARQPRLSDRRARRPRSRVARPYSRMTPGTTPVAPADLDDLAALRGGISAAATSLF